MSHYGRGSTERDGHSIARHLYGAIIVLAVLITADDHSQHPFKVAAVLATTVAVLLGMETYADVIAEEISLRRPLTRQERRSAARELMACTGAAEAPLLFLVLAGFGVISEPTAFTLAKGATLAVLFCYGYVARKVAGLSNGEAAMAAAVVAGVGVLLAIGKGYIHL